jgi:hypothetical protein
MASFSLTPSQKRAALIRGRQDLEKLIYAIGLTLDLELENADLTKISHLWSDEDGNSTIAGDPNEHAYKHLEHLCNRLRSIIDKLEGPNRIV